MAEKKDDSGGSKPQSQKASPAPATGQSPFQEPQMRTVIGGAGPPDKSARGRERGGDGSDGS